MDAWEVLATHALALLHRLHRPPSAREAELADEIEQRQEEVARRLLALQVRAIRARPPDAQEDPDEPVH